MHFDVGGYDYHRQYASATAPQRLDERGQRPPRAHRRNSASSWATGITPSSTTSAARRMALPAPAARRWLEQRRYRHRFPSGRRACQEFENAYLSYTGFKPFGGNARDRRRRTWTLLVYAGRGVRAPTICTFMERASSGVIATNIAAGDFRSAVGARWYNGAFWAGAYVDGSDDSGAIHSASSINPPWHNRTIWRRGPRRRVKSSVARTILCTSAATPQFLIQPPHNLVAQGRKR